MTTKSVNNALYTNGCHHALDMLGFKCCTRHEETNEYNQSGFVSVCHFGLRLTHPLVHAWVWHSFAMRGSFLFCCVIGRLRGQQTSTVHTPACSGCSALLHNVRHVEALII